MFRRFSLLLVVCVLGIQSADAMFRRCGGDFRSDDDKAQHAAMDSWIVGDHVARLRAERSLVTSNPEFAAFLNEFVSLDDVKAVLAQRVYRDRSKALTPELRVELLTLLKSWHEKFIGVLKEHGAEVVSDLEHFPGTITFRFEAFPLYDVSCRAWNQYVLGFYSTEDGSEGKYCNPCGSYIGSHYPFPSQLVSRVLYAEEVEASIDSSGISSVAVPKHYIYEFPDGVEELDDHNLFIITDHVNFDSGFHDAVVAALKAEYADISVDALRAMAADATNVSLLANMVRVVCAAGLWELNVKFVAAPDGSVVAFLTHMERPAFGGGEPVKFFHKDREGEVMSNVRVGLEWVADWLKSPEAAAASE